MRCRLIPQAWREEAGRIIRYALVGVLNTVVGLGTIYLLQNGFGCDYRIANTIGYALGIINSFFFNRTWTFKSTDNRLTRQGILFLMVAGACWGVQLVAVIGMVEFLGIPKELAQVLGMGFYTGLNYLGSRFIVFRKTAQQTATEAPEKTQDTD